jgi:integrase
MFPWYSRNVRHTRKKKGRSEKGLGTLQQRGRLWYFRITIDGKEYTHATKTADLEQARLERDRFLRTIRPASSLAPLHETVTVAELVDDYVAVKKDNHQRSADDIERALKVNVLRAEMFQGRVAASITTQDLKNYRELRKAIGRKDATINNELSYLRSAFFYGQKQTPKKVVEVPYFPIVKINNTRLGFIELADYKKILACMCGSLKLFFVLAYHSGCRSGELTNLRWDQVKRELGIIQLEPGTTKNDEGRNLPIYGDMAHWLDQQAAIRKAQCPDCEYVLFWHQAEVDTFVRRKAGDKLNSFASMWQRAVDQAGFPDLIPHDLRRSALRNMNQEVGIPEVQCMKISGHKTAATFLRYNIVSLKGVIEVGKKMDAWMASQSTV